MVAPTESLVLSALNCALWAILPVSSPRAAQSLGRVSPAVHALMRPAAVLSLRARQLSRQLHSLPFGYAFGLPTLETSSLEEALILLRSVRLLRRREIVAVSEEGWAPTFEESWHFSSASDLSELVHASRLALRTGRCNNPRMPALTLGLVLRHEDDRADGSLLTSAMGTEWVDGPAADPLQLGLRLTLGPSGRSQASLQFVSGGWSEWAESWSTADGSLGASMVLAAPLPGGQTVLLRPDLSGEETCGDVSVPDENVEALISQLRSNTGGVRAIVVLTQLRWLKERPAWCPDAIHRVQAVSMPK